jgi:hypothetical protein
VRAELTGGDWAYKTRHAVLDLRGGDTVRTVDQRILGVSGGLAKVTGPIDVTVEGDGVDGAAIFDVAAPHPAFAHLDELGRIVIDAPVTIDARGCTATGVRLFALETGTEVVIRAPLTVMLPATTAPLLPATGTIRCEGEGVIRYSVEGAADDAGTLGLYDHDRIRVQSLDGTVDWDTVRSRMRTTHQDGDLGITVAGTGAIVRSVLQPRGTRGAWLMDARGEGAVQVRLDGRKTGTAGTARLLVYLSGSFAVQVTLPAAAGHFTAELRIDWQGAGSQRCRLTVAHETGTVSGRSVEAETYSPGEPACRLDVEAAVGDAIELWTVETAATLGGTV